MEPSYHRFSELFAQLGLPNSEAEIRAFIAAHRPLPPQMALAEASFWTPAQVALLQEQLREDADWAELIDQLNLALH